MADNDVNLRFCDGSTVVLKGGEAAAVTERLDQLVQQRDRAQPLQAALDGVR